MGCLPTRRYAARIADRAARRLPEARTEQLTDKVGWVVVRRDGEADVIEEVNDLVDVTEVGGLAVAQQQQLVEHVEDLRGGLVHRDDQRLALLLGVPLQARHEHVC